ncbi:MAG TPA: HAMP domain-containing sensor histidine kinase [Alphaproteobacteria bacterium]|nr:HAMP domain-containing sensor histidine kinase [Alphaproteobacteria bacterium]
MEWLTRYRVPIAVSCLLLGMAGLFILDIVTPPGVADGIGYPILLVLCLWLPGRHTLSVCAWGSTLLIVVGGFFGQVGGIGLEASLINRALGLISMWVIYWLLEQRVAMERSLRISEQDAVAASQAKANFLANVSHELRTPLNAIIGFSDLIAKEALGPVGEPRYRDYAEDIYGSASQLSVLINDMIDLTRLEAGKYRLAEETVVPTDMVADVLRMVGPAARESEIELYNRVPVSLPPIRVDRRAFKQVMLNLFSNAIKFTPMGGRVVVGAEADANGFTLSVQDSGIGISKENLARLGRPFETLERGSGERVGRTTGGTGLGLAFCQSLIGLHGGRLDIESVEGKGTTVHIHLPKERIFAGHA